MTKVAIIGAGGYVGGELARLLAHHPHAKLVCAATNTYAGKPLRSVFPSLAGSPVGELLCESGGADAPGVAQAEIVFLAQDNGVSMHTAPKLLAGGKRVVDMAADFRLTNVDTFAAFYKMEHAAPDLLHAPTTVYGLPERNRDAIRSARLVANPGCHVTAAVLALSPLLADEAIETNIIIDSKTGLSGAGRAKNDLTFKFSEANESVAAYGVGGTHRHTPEIEQTLTQAAFGEAVAVTFTPHLVPMTRGILSTCYARLKNTDLSAADLYDLFGDAYANEPFVVLREPGDQPRTKDVWGSNFCHLCVTLDGRTGTVIVTSAIDNLVKGAAGQAIQNMNIMCGFPETAGLEGAGICP